jgi:hypothetical protein
MTFFIPVDSNQAPAALQLPEEDQFPALSGLLEDILTPQLEVGSDPLKPDEAFGFYVERLRLDVPLELQSLRNEKNEFAMGASFPTQWIETSVEPVLHRLRLTLEIDDQEPEHADHNSGNQTLES